MFKRLLKRALLELIEELPDDVVSKLRDAIMRI